MTNRYTLAELLDRLGLDYDSRRRKMDCFNCGKKLKINLDFDNNFWRCPACEVSGGVLHLFARQVMDIELDSDSPKDTKINVSKELDKFMGGSDPAQRRPETQKEKPPIVPVAEDGKMDAVYRALQSIPALALSAAHRKELKRRGLTDEAIDRNGYRTIPGDMSKGKDYEELYEMHGGEMRRNDGLSWLSKNQICFGIFIAKVIQAQGLDPKGVPGFFRYGQLWCFWAVPGLLIPTRNIDGQIVAWQLRRDRRRKSEAKYITVASRSLPGHVTQSVSRTHFPLHNTPLSSSAPVIFTEGPLKADIASELFPGKTVFAAIPGITTTADLLANCDRFKQAGVTKIFNAADMDRYTNPHVRKGVNKLVEALHARGLTVEDMCWDQQYAVHLHLIFSHVAKKRGITVADVGPSVFAQLNAVADALNKAGIDLCSYLDENGTRVDCYWRSEFKGIDDYLLHNR